MPSSSSLPSRGAFPPARNPPRRGAWPRRPQVRRPGAHLVRVLAHADKRQHDQTLAVVRELIEPKGGGARSDTDTAMVVGEAHLERGIQLQSHPRRRRGLHSSLSSTWSRPRPAGTVHRIRAVSRPGPDLVCRASNCSATTVQSDGRVPRPMTRPSPWRGVLPRERSRTSSAKARAPAAPRCDRSWTRRPS